jgi:hypothetical protein
LPKKQSTNEGDLPVFKENHDHSLQTRSLASISENYIFYKQFSHIQKGRKFGQNSTVFI